MSTRGRWRSRTPTDACTAKVRPHTDTHATFELMELIARADRRSVPRTVSSDDDRLLTPLVPLVSVSFIVVLFHSECVKKAESYKLSNLVSIAPKPGRYIFSVEGTGALNVDQIVKTAIDVLYRKLSLIEDEVHIEILKDTDRREANY